MRTRLERAIDRRDDLQDYLSKWGFGMSPSEKRAMERKIAKAAEKVDRLGGAK